MGEDIIASVVAGIVMGVVGGAVSWLVAIKIVQVEVRYLRDELEEHKRAVEKKFDNFAESVTRLHDRIDAAFSGKK